MSAEKPRVRFAPSPTGDLHVGNARTALFNWMFARHYGGEFILRIEDTDAVRTSKDSELRIIEDLTWLAIDWDEGPGAGGEKGPYHQRQRLDLYDHYLKMLIRADCVYPCYCTEEELEAERAELVFRKMTPRYLGKCRNLSDTDRKTLEAQGREPAYRFRVGTGWIEFDDLIRGAMKFDAETIGDFIIVRSNGIPAYNFAVVVDDHLMDVSHVIRGEDHLSNTALQLLIYKALGLNPPIFAHHALILGKDRSKLSKRHGAVAVREFREKGILAEVMLNYLALLGGSIGGGREVCTREEMISSFSLDRAGKSGAVFDEDKLKWLNGIYIRQGDLHSLTEQLLPFIMAAGYHDIDNIGRGRLEQIVDAVRGDVALLSDIGEQMDIFFDDRFAVSGEAQRLLGEREARGVVGALVQSLEGLPLCANNFYQEIIASVEGKTGAKGKKLFLPIRAAVTGRIKGPELDKIFAILSPASLKYRVETALSGSSGTNR
ncbi:MAG: glutamate--tRNA ligase [Syntrophus sp. (in: bacteria)]|nr:glutamate--tRNA ligase [Syntrophus sp. (in: bacteria)]